MKSGLYICPKCNSTHQIQLEDKDIPESFDKIHCINCGYKGLKFTKLAVSYCMKPKGADSEVTLNYFFSIWATFILDFKEAWKKESQKLSKQRY